MGLEILLLERALQLQKVPTPSRVWFACSPWHPRLTPRLSSDHGYRKARVARSVWASSHRLGSGALAYVAPRLLGAY